MIEDHASVDALIGSVLLQPSIIHNVTFVEPRHIPGPESDVWRAMLECAESDDPINIIAIEQRLPHFNGQVARIVNRVIGKVPHVGNAEVYAQNVIEAYERRRVATLGQDLITGAHNTQTDVEEVKSSIAGQLLDGGMVADVQMANDIADADIITVTEWAENPIAADDVRGIPTGLVDLDNLIDGLWPGLFVLAGRTSMGKTAVALRIATNVAASSPVLYCTFEQSARYMWRRIVCTNAGIDFRQAKRGLSPDDLARYTETAERLRGLPIGFYDGSNSGGKNLATVTASINRFRQKHGGVGLVVLDNLGHIRTGEETYRELGSVTKAMLQLSTRFECTILGLHQLNRGVEMRTNKRPTMADLRDSGYIEEDAVLIGLLYRDDYYNTASTEANIIEMAIVKNKEDGRLGKADLSRNPRTGDIANARTAMHSN